MKKKDKFITVTRTYDNFKIHMNVSHIIDVHSTRENIYKQVIKRRKTWLGFGKTIEVATNVYNGYGPGTGSNITTTQQTSIGGYSGHVYGGKSMETEVNESPKSVLKKIEDA